MATFQSFLQVVRQSGCVNFIDSHAYLQSWHCCKLNPIAWVVELTYLHVIVKCESLLGGHGEARCTITIPILTHLSRHPRNPQALMSDQISFCEKLGVRAAKLEEVDAVNKDLLAQKLFLNILKTMKDHHCSRGVSLCG